MAFGLRMRKTAQSVIEQRVKTAAEILGLTDVLYRKPKTLNAEQKQKVVLGRAIVREPKLYLFDDPIAGLDADLRAQMRNVIINLQARMNGTFIYATKNVNEALTMATRVVVLREGVVQQIDTPANLYDYPANAYVAFLIGSPTINFVNNAQLVKEDGAVYATLKDVKIPVPESVLARFEGVDKYIEEGKSVIIGIRPEDMTVAEEGIFTATVASTEKVGETTFAECDVNDKLTVVLAVEGAEKGAKVSINADLSRMYIFDGETRLNLLARDGGYKKTKYADADVIPMEYNQEEEVKKTISAQAQPNQPTKSKRK
jgi:multiple sugar transport system ATP-binding protein